jgi:hypothetical protein
LIPGRLDVDWRPESKTPLTYWISGAFSWVRG